MQPEAVNLPITNMDLTWTQARLVERLCAEEYDQFHTWLPRAARLMQMNDMTPQQIFPVLRERADYHTRPVPTDEVCDAINLVFGTEMEASQGETKAVGFRDLHWKHKLALISQSDDWESDYTLKDVMASNLVEPRELCSIDPRNLVGLLFKNANPDEDLICVGKRKPYDTGFVNRTISLREFQEGELCPDFNLIVPNSPTQRHGFTKSKGVRSQRALESFPNRRYVVLESDIGPGTWDIQARLIKFAGKVWERDPVMVVCSGGKSLHSWFSAEGLEESRIRDFVTDMKGLFDTATLQRNQFVRLPNRKRGKKELSAGMVQAPLFIDWKALI